MQSFIPSRSEEDQHQNQTTDTEPKNLEIPRACRYDSNMQPYGSMPHRNQTTMLPDPELIAMAFNPRALSAMRLEHLTSPSQREAFVNPKYIMDPPIEDNSGKLQTFENSPLEYQYIFDKDLDDQSILDENFDDQTIVVQTPADRDVLNEDSEDEEVGDEETESQDIEDQDMNDQDISDQDISDQDISDQDIMDQYIDYENTEDQDGIQLEDSIIPLPTQNQIRIHLKLLERLTRQDKPDATFVDRMQPNPQFFNDNWNNLPYRAEGELALTETKELCEKWRPIFKWLVEMIETKFEAFELENDFEPEFQAWVRECKDFEFRAFGTPEKTARNLEKLEEKYVRMGHRFLELNDELSTEWIKEHYALGYFKPFMAPKGRAKTDGNWWKVDRPEDFASKENWKPTLQAKTEFFVIDSLLYVTYHDGYEQKLALCSLKTDSDGNEYSQLIHKPLDTCLQTSLETFEELGRRPHIEPAWRRKFDFNQ